MSLKRGGAPVTDPHRHPPRESGVIKLSLPQFPRRRAALPQRIQVLLITQRIHGLPETPMHPCSQLTISSQIFHRLLFPTRIVTVDEFQDAAFEDEETSVDEAAFGRGLLFE